MFKKNLGNAVASEMEAVLNSDEYAKYFSKQAEAKCGCPGNCECHKKLGMHAPEDCGCKEKEAKSSVELEVEAPGLKESFDNLVDKFVSLSSELDELGFDKASASVLKSFDILLKEAAGEGIEKEVEEAIEAIQQLGDDAVEINVDIDEKEPTIDERLLGGEDEDMDLDLATTIQALDELGLGEKSPEESLSEEEQAKVKGLGLGLASAELAEIEKATQEVNDWLSKNASEEDLSGGPSVDFELDAELSALLAEDLLDDQLLSTAEKEEEEEEEEDCLQANYDEEFEDEE